MPKRHAVLCLMSLLAFAAPIGARAADLTVCIDTSAASAPMDRKIADAVAKQEKLSLAIHEFNGGGDGDDGFPIKNFRALATSQCALVLGFPVDLTAGLLPPGLVATAPYAQVGFVLVTPKTMAARSLAAIRPNTDVGVTYLTTPNLYFLTHPNMTANVFTTENETMQSLIQHKVKAVLVWRPTVINYMLQHPAGPKFNVYPLNEPHARWNIVALHSPASEAIAQQFDDGVDRLRSAGALAALESPFATPTARPLKAADAAPRERPPIVLAAFTSGSPAPESPAPAPALYTQAQAESGHQKFLANCAICHGKDLSGMVGPALRGKNFASVKADFHVGDVFKIVSQNMPASQPGTLPHQDYVDIMAFLLQQNGYPAGPATLTFDSAQNSTVPLRYHGE